MSDDLTLYRDLLGEIKVRVRAAQHKAALLANLEMLLMYWDIGRMIAARQKLEGWGAGVLPKLAADLKNELPEEKGFSLRNLKLMVQFHQEYPDAFPIGQRTVAQLRDASELPLIGQPTVAQLGAQPVSQSSRPAAAEIVQQAVVQLSWAHNVILIQKLKHLPTRIWYARQTLEQGWSRHQLRHHSARNPRQPCPRAVERSLPL